MPFRDVVGHRRLIDLLARSIRRDALPPSLLFAGPDSGGTRDTAIAVAQALNCTQLTTDELSTRSIAAGAAAACTRIARGMHPDVLVVEPGDSGSIKIEQVRDVVDRSRRYRPFEGRRRVVIIDDADALVTAAQNALLKTLEEPPSSSVFILVTARPDALLPRSRSRAAFGLTIRGRAGRRTMRIAEARDGRASACSRARCRRGGEPGTSPRGGARICSSNTGGGSGAGDREQLASHLRAMASLLRDVEVLATGAGERLLAQPDVRAGARAADARVPRRARRATRSLPSIAGSMALERQCRRQDRRGLGGGAAVSVLPAVRSSPSS